MRKSEQRESKKDTFVAIGGSIAGIYMVIVIMFLIFAKESVDLLLPIAWAFVVLGIALGFFASLSRKGKKN